MQLWKQQTPSLSFCLQFCPSPAPTWAAPCKFAALLDYDAWKTGLPLMLLGTPAPADAHQ